MRVYQRINKVFIPSNNNAFWPTFLKPKNLFILAVVLLVIKFLIFSWFYYYPKTSQFAVVVASRLTELANQERIALGLQPLKINQQLVQAAQQKAQDMLSKNYFNHVSPTGVIPWYWLDSVGYKYTAAGENLAKDFKESEFVHQAWMESSSHRKNILNKNYQEIGIAVVEGTINGEKTVLAVQFFGKSTKITASFYPKKITEEKTEKGPLAISVEEQKAEDKKEVESKEINLKGPLVFQQRENLKEAISEKSQNILSSVKNNSESIVKKFYFIILGVISLVLLLAIFINIRVQYPKLIFTALIFIILIAGIACFNGQEFLNRGIDIL